MERFILLLLFLTHATFTSTYMREIKRFSLCGMDHGEIGGTIRLKSICDPCGIDHGEIGGTSQSVIYNLSHFHAKFTCAYMRKIIKFWRELLCY